MFYSTYASSTQQERLVNLLHFAGGELGCEDAERGWSLVTTVHECLHSANFWEQENIRCKMTSPTAFLNYLPQQQHFLLFSMPEPRSWTPQMLRNHERMRRSASRATAQRVRCGKP